MLRFALSAAMVFAASAAQAKIPLFNATCGNNLFEVHADEGGPVYINGHEARLKVYNSNAYEAVYSHTKVGITLTPDGSLLVNYTRPKGHGECNLVEYDLDSDASACPSDISEANRWMYPGCE